MRRINLPGLLLLICISLFSGGLGAQILVNGNLSTGDLTSAGASAPAGYTWSELQLTNTTSGLGANISANLTLADDFIITGTTDWTVDSIKVYAYSTGYAGSTSPFNDARLQIFNTDPSVGSPVPVWGDLTTNRYGGGVSAKMYRIFAGATTGLQDREIWEIKIPVNTVLSAGHYWIEWQLGTVTPGGSNFTPSSTVAGTTTQLGNNAKQHDIAGGTWTNVTDTGPQDFHFKVYYTTTPCSGTPVPGNTLTSSSSVCPGQLFTLSIADAPSNMGITFQWQSSATAGGPFNDIPGATSATLVTSQTTATYYQLVVSCNGNPGTSTPVFVDMNAPNTCYCDAGATSTDFEKIDQVIFGDLNNSSTSTAGYEDFTALTPVPEYSAGASYPVTVNSADSYSGDMLRIWIDFDQSGSFEASEMVFSTTNPQAGPYTGNIQIPSTATDGNTRMRIRLYDDSFGNGNDTPCGDQTYGQVEDYTISIVHGSDCVGTPAPGPVLSTETAVCPGQTFGLSIADPPLNAGITFQWQSSSTAGGPFQDIAGATNSSLTTTQATATYYQLVVSCNGNPGIAAAVFVDMTPANQCYCDAASTSTDFEKIDQVIFGSLNNSSTSTDGYEDFTTLTPVPVYEAGSSYPFTVNSADSYDGDMLRIWIDFNQNGTFDSNELVYSTTNGQAGPYTGNILIPANATLGNTRMRIRLYDDIFGNGNDTPCGDQTYGQVEDYTINIAPCQPATINAQPQDITANCSSSGSFSVAATGTDLHYEWQVNDGSGWTLISNGSVYSGQGTATLGILATTDAMSGNQYQVAVSGGCTATFLSDAATLTVGPNTPMVNPTSAEICAGSGTVVPIALSTTTAWISSGQVDLTIPDTNEFATGSNVGISSTINVTDVPSGANVTGVSVKLNIVHQWIGDLVIVLKAPNGQVYNLDYALTNTGGTDATTGFTNTIISSAGTVPLVNGTDPWTGTFAPDNQDPAETDPSLIPLGPAGFLPTTRNFSDLYDTPNGDWTLAVYDIFNDELTTNKLSEWSINFTYGSSSPGTFSPTDGLFTDDAGTIPYSGGLTTQVYAAPTESTDYTVSISAPGCETGSVVVPVMVTTPITDISVNDVTLCVEGDATFTADITGGPATSYTWEVSFDNGASWSVLDEDVDVIGTTTSQLTLLGMDESLDGIMFRVTATSCGDAAQAVATLHVYPDPVVSLTSGTLYPSVNTTITASSDPAGVSYTWNFNGQDLTGVSGNTYSASVDQIGYYVVTVVDQHGCTGSSDPYLLQASPNPALFIYPSPTNGTFSVSFYSDASTSPLVRELNVYDSKGARVFSKKFSILVQYQRMDVDLSAHPAGVYRVELLDRTGKRIKTGSVIKL